ncbi:MAG: hypothetical protein WDW21_02560 [Neisseriaceae bacterium]
MKNFIESFIFKINKTLIVPTILLLSIFFSYFMSWYFSYQKLSDDKEIITFYTYYNLLIELFLAFLIGRYFQLEESANNYNKLLQIPNRSNWFFSVILCFIFILILSVIFSYSVFFIFGHTEINYITLITVVILTVLLNIIYIPCFLYLALRFNSNISIALSFVLVPFIIYYGLNTPGEGIRQYIPFLYPFAALKAYFETNYLELFKLIETYILALVGSLLIINKWYRNWDGN